LYADLIDRRMTDAQPAIFLPKGRKREASPVHSEASLWVYVVFVCVKTLTEKFN
jgi:hypothetical protein